MRNLLSLLLVSTCLQQPQAKADEQIIDQLIIKAALSCSPTHFGFMFDQDLQDVVVGFLWCHMKWGQQAEEAVTSPWHHQRLGHMMTPYQAQTTCLHAKMAKDSSSKWHHWIKIAELGSGIGWLCICTEKECGAVAAIFTQSSLMSEDGGRHSLSGPVVDVRSFPQQKLTHLFPLQVWRCSCTVLRNTHTHPLCSKNNTGVLFIRSERVFTGSTLTSAVSWVIGCLKLTLSALRSFLTRSRSASRAACRRLWPLNSTERHQTQTSNGGHKETLILPTCTSHTTVD